MVRHGRVQRDKFTAKPYQNDHKPYTRLHRQQQNERKWSKQNQHEKNKGNFDCDVLWIPNAKCLAQVFKATACASFEPLWSSPTGRSTVHLCNWKMVKQDQLPFSTRNAVCCFVVWSVASYTLVARSPCPADPMKMVGGVGTCFIARSSFLQEK